MDLKEVIHYIAEEDLELNITFQAGSEDLAQELGEIKELLRNEGNVEVSDNVSVDTGELEPLFKGVSEDIEELRKEVNDLKDKVGREPQPEKIVSEATIGSDDSSEEDEVLNATDKPVEDVEETTEEFEGEPEDDGESFDEVFGEEEEETEPEPEPVDEPTEEERSEAGADFEQLFGEV